MRMKIEKIKNRKEERLLTITQVAELSGFSYRTIWNWTKTGYIKSVRIGHDNIRIPSTEYYKLSNNRK